MLTHDPHLLVLKDMMLIRQSSNELDSSSRRKLSNRVILSEAKDLTRWAEILRFTQDETIELFKLSRTLLHY